MKNLPFILIILPLLLFSCKRLDGDTLVEGQVVDKFTGAGVPHAWVGVYGKSNKTTWGSYTLQTERQADANGNFGFQFDSSDKHYQLQAYTPEGYHTLTDDAVRLKSGKNNKNLKIKAEPPAWVKVKVVNVPPFEVARLHIKGGFTQDGNGQQTIVLNGISGDTTIIRYVYMGVNSVARWIYRSDGSVDHLILPVSYVGNDTTEVLIEY